MSSCCLSFVTGEISLLIFKTSTVDPGSHLPRWTDRSLLFVRTAVDVGDLHPVVLDGALSRCWPDAHMGCSVFPEPRCLLWLPSRCRNSLEPTICSYVSSYMPWPVLGLVMAPVPSSNNVLSPSLWSDLRARHWYSFCRLRIWGLERQVICTSDSDILVCVTFAVLLLCSTLIEAYWAGLSFELQDTYLCALRTLKKDFPGFIVSFQWLPP